VASSNECCEDLLPLRISKILNFPENFENGSVKIGKGTAPRFFHNIPNVNST